MSFADLDGGPGEASEGEVFRPVRFAGPPHPVVAQTATGHDIWSGHRTESETMSDQVPNLSI
jgi:hypothetical protein